LEGLTMTKFYIFSIVVGLVGLIAGLTFLVFGF
jgi:hypothetical protein